VRPYLENKTESKMTEGMVQVVEHLPSKHKALNSSPRPSKKKICAREEKQGLTKIHKIHTK
jgi:hypothetical protein